ncbi:ankyrin repeat-containing protein ITN1-like [Quercus lobata]|uniref:ankyrin repeat-containing protein ITN1-like n=1 Tax=Quercus lobata TaxID=97700 RepID=UPI001244E8E7|nr:ankyrin repeat-containing protein ITN1-like [Quercus lobata]
MQGNVPLHLAASTGSLRKCICIAKADPSLGNERNKEGESPLFSAAILGRTEIFLCLRSICKNELHSSYFRKNGGETILHCAIKRNCWDLAYQLLLLNHSKKKKLLLPNSGLATSVDEKLATFVDEKGNTPLHFLADKPSAFKNIPDRDLDCSLRPSVEIWKNSQPQKQSLFQKLDNEGNSALHLAATPSEQKSGLIPGAALQMQWEIKWYEHIKNSLPPGFLHLLNNEGKSSGEIFKENHKDLVEKGGKWLSSTSKACSVVAGLFVTVAFNMSTTVPGGVNQEGTPNLENQIPFYIFATSSYVSFYSSLLALIMFLAILTSGYKESSFRSTLPIKLLLGLTAFYVSIVSTSISFSAGHFFIVKDKMKYAAFPVYSGVLLLLIFFVIAGFPLYFHLTWAIFKKVPHHHYRITRAGFHLKH